MRDGTKPVAGDTMNVGGIVYEVVSVADHQDVDGDWLCAVRRPRGTRVYAARFLPYYDGGRRGQILAPLGRGGSTS